MVSKSSASRPYTYYMHFKRKKDKIKYRQTHTARWYSDYGEYKNIYTIFIVWGTFVFCLMVFKLLLLPCVCVIVYVVVTFYVGSFFYKYFFV